MHVRNEAKVFPDGTGMGRTLARGGSAWLDAGGALALAAAIALWVAGLLFVAAPLGDALARLDRQTPRPEVPCPVPPGALASASRGARARDCR